MPSSIWTIRLNDMQFYAYHGVYAIEKKIGQWYSINIEVQFSKNTISLLEDSLNYEKLYSIVKLQMQQPHELLETLAQRIEEDIKQLDNKLDEYCISIKKIHPLMGKEVASSEVVLRKTYN